jgi:hypothetical protein
MGDIGFLMAMSKTATVRTKEPIYCGRVIDTTLEVRTVLSNCPKNARRERRAPLLTVFMTLLAGFYVLFVTSAPGTRALLFRFGASILLLLAGRVLAALLTGFDMLFMAAATIGFVVWHGITPYLHFSPPR